MRRDHVAFFSLIFDVQLVIDGKDYYLPRDNEANCETHTLPRVLLEMILQIVADNHGLPDYRTLSLDEIVLFYNGGREELKRRTKK